jgi:hypothetical protein
METDLPTASVGSSQAPTAAVDKSQSASHTEFLTLPTRSNVSQWLALRAAVLRRAVSQ